MANGQTKVVVAQRGIGFCGVLFIILLLLKVGVVETVVMSWSWIWITAPLWGPLAIFCGVIVIAMLASLAALGICALIDLIRK